MTPDAVSLSRVSVGPRSRSDGVHDVVVPSAIAEIGQSIVRFVGIRPVSDVETGRSRTNKGFHDQVMDQPGLSVDSDQLVSVHASRRQYDPFFAFSDTVLGDDDSVKGSDLTFVGDLIIITANDWLPFHELNSTTDYIKAGQP